MMSERMLEIERGVAMVVTDLHGAWEVYERLRDIFLRLRAQGEVDTLVLCGDLIHADDPKDDRSLDILLDVMRLHGELGSEGVVMLLGNHELPHIYSTTLARGNLLFTPPFEAALAKLDGKRGKPHRSQVMDFLMNLPLYAATKAGVLLTHAGAAGLLTKPENVRRLLEIDHRALLEDVDRSLATHDLNAARSLYEKITGAPYDEEVKTLLAVRGAGDPRYNDLLRGMVATNTPEFSLLWDTLMTQNEFATGRGMEHYLNVVQLFLIAVSKFSLHPQRVLVAGHMSAQGGYMLLGEQQLRLATYSHARPQSEGRYLLFDCGKPVHSVSELVPGLRETFA
jgi:hypothetical protein